MKMTKILTVVLTLIISIIISLDYLIATRTLTKTAFNEPIIIVKEANQNEDYSKVDSTQIAKDEEITKPRGTVTSRSGKHESIQNNVEENSSTETKINSEESVPESKETETENSVQPQKTENTEPEEEIIEEPIEEPVEEAEPIEEEPVVEKKPTYEGIELEYSAVYNVSSNRLTKSKGAIYYNGHKETYYSQKVLPGKGLKALNNNGRHVADDGTVRDGDGYIAVACNYLPKGSEIMTSLGPGKVYDTGSMTGKWIDIYVNW